MNKNGKIDLSDVITLLRKYLNDDATEEEVEIGDMDENENIGLKDIIILLRTYLEGWQNSKNAKKVKKVNKKFKSVL